MNPEIVQEYLIKTQEWAVSFIPKLLLAVLILWIGLKVAKKLSRLISKSLDRAGIEIEVKEFLASIIDVILKGVVFLIAASGLIYFQITTGRRHSKCTQRSKKHSKKMISK